MAGRGDRAEGDPPRPPTPVPQGKSFTRKGDAERYKTEIEHSKIKGNYVNPQLGKVKFGDLAERWYATTADMRPTTRSNYRYALDHYLLPVFAQTPINRISRSVIQEWIADCVEKGTGAQTIKFAHIPLRLIFDTGVSDGMLTTNPARKVRLPKIVVGEMRVLTVSEIEHLARTIREPYGVLIKVAAYSGMRFSELAGLKVGRLDLLNGKIKVEEVITDPDGILYTGPPKTAASRRTIWLPRSIAQELGAYLATRPHGPEDYVFTMPKGGPLRHSNFMWYHFMPAVKAAGLKPFNFHGLRHTCASLMIAQGSNVKLVQKQMGHATAAMTLDVYGAMFPDDMDKAMDRLDQARGDGKMWPERGPEVIQLRQTGA